MVKYIAAYVATLVVMLACDSVWLTLTATALYKNTLGDILLPTFLIAPALAFYLLYVIGLVIFAVAPAMRSGNWTTAALQGAMFGFFAYGTYDLTNMATLRNWTSAITFADMCWGTVLSATASSLGYLISRAGLRAAHVEV